MKGALLSFGCLAVATAVAPACGGGFGSIGEGKKLVVTITKGEVGAPQAPLLVDVSQPTPFTVSIQAQLPDGSVDTSFNGYVNVSAQPGTVDDLSVRNVQLTNGVVDNLVVPIVGTFGEGHIWAIDLGYEPVAPNRQPPPECSDGIDNNHNGLVDYPADPGCYAPIDDTEDLGTYAAGATETIYFALPRIALVRGYDPANNGDGNATAFPEQQISIDTGWRGGTSYAFSTVVIGLTSAGFYVQDLQNDVPNPTGYGGLYAYNFATPTNMRVCDRLQILSGTSADFYGFTELNYPAWQLEYWNPMTRPCLVPEPTTLGPPDLVNENRLWQLEATNIRTITAGTTTVQVAAHFGPNNVPLVNGSYVPNADSSNCDFDHSGKINYDDPGESACAAACVGSCSEQPTDSQCSEWSAYESENGFELIVTDPTKTPSQARIQADASAANLFDPVASRGQFIHSFTGLVSYFSGGCQFTMSARCQDDIVASMSAEPLAANVACVHPRTLSDLNDNEP
jgi:hypothetical protein